MLNTVSRLRYVLVGLLAFGAASAKSQPDSLTYQVAFPSLPPLSFPLGLEFANDGSNRLYTSEYQGRIRVFENRVDADTAYVYLDLTEQIQTDPNRPAEFYSIAFHPDYASNGYVFVYYVAPDPDRSVIARYTRSTDDDWAADPASEVILLEIPQPVLNNHNGGRLAFGPDGYLYLSLGDGGLHLDNTGNAQNRENLLGSIIRIDVDHTEGDRNYAIPFDNPFVGNEQGWREEIWAYGFRNPWRISFDRLTGDLWVADVGEEAWEEVNLVERGRNYGWNIMEGPDCLNGGPCSTEGLAEPYYSYGREDGRSITGGFVYRGSDMPSLYGQYIYGDFNGMTMWSLEADGGSSPTAVKLLDAFPIASLGEDRDGELYLPHFFRGQIYSMSVVQTAEPIPSGPPSPVAIAVAPNPFRSQARVSVVLQEGGDVTVALYDMLGRRVRTLFEGDLAPNQLRYVDLPSTGLAAGTYIVRTESAAGVETQRVTLLR